jgi:hypothetical protein
MADRHPVLFLTDRGKRHQQAALDAAPPELDVTMVRRPSKAEILRLLPGRRVPDQRALGRDRCRHDRCRATCV